SPWPPSPAAASAHPCPDAYNPINDPRKRHKGPEKGRSVMPFDLERTTHRFTKSSNGGVQTVVADDPGDQEQIRLIREHLTKEFAAFQRGDFADPASIHGAEMPGLSTLAQGYKRIQMSFETVQNGARILFTTDDAGLVDALHAWFDAQVSDHGRHAEHGQPRHGRGH
ncbi:hypothetical protein, partial [Spirillospora sp. NPDC048823]|uniref:hypothetical protein n=1 Tax=unclassified Spirillospora TaxID=2642701 RepID=UPI003714971B